MSVKIVKQVLEKQVSEGMKLKALSEYYGLPVTRMKAALKQAGLRIRSFRNSATFEIVDEETNTLQEASPESLTPTPVESVKKSKKVKEEKVEQIFDSPSEEEQIIDFNDGLLDQEEPTDQNEDDFTF